MNEFIHTFSAVTHLSLTEKDNLTLAYYEDIFFNGEEKVFVFHKYAENGLRVHIEFASSNEKKYDKEHRAYKVELIVTPAKLIFGIEEDLRNERLYGYASLRKSEDRIEGNRFFIHDGGQVACEIPQENSAGILDSVQAVKNDRGFAICDPSGVEQSRFYGRIRFAARLLICRERVVLRHG